VTTYRNKWGIYVPGIKAGSVSAEVYERLARRRAERNTMDENESNITKAAKDFKAKSGAVIQRLNRLCGDSARQYPAEYVEVEQREAMAELATLESAMLGTAGQAHERELAVADEIYAKDPRDHSAVMADELQIARLSRMHPDKISARNNLIGEARRLASLDAFDGARPPGGGSSVGRRGLCPRQAGPAAL